VSDHEAKHAGKPLSDRAEKARAAAEEPHEHKHVRVTTEPVEGSDPTPAPKASRAPRTDNDARLKAEKPPHY
jgi:hypothetical protein